MTIDQEMVPWGLNILNKKLRRFVILKIFFKVTRTTKLLFKLLFNLFNRY